MELPDLIELNDFGGDIELYIDYLYNGVFRQDFFVEGITFRSKKVHIVFKPKIDNYEFSFVHATSTGPYEPDREWDLSRSARLGWIKPLIEAADSTDTIWVWENVRRKKVGRKTKKSKNTLIFDSVNRFVIILSEEKKVWRFKSSYLASSQGKFEKFKEEYEEYIKK